MAASTNRLYKAFGITAAEHVESNWSADSDANLEVIGLGLPRTGTTSLRAALGLMGFGPVHHGVVSSRELPSVISHAFLTECTNRKSIADQGTERT